MTERFRNDDEKRAWVAFANAILPARSVRGEPIEWTAADADALLSEYRARCEPEPEPVAVEGAREGWRTHEDRDHRHIASNVIVYESVENPGCYSATANGPSAPDYFPTLTAAQERVEQWWREQQGDAKR